MFAREEIRVAGGLSLKSMRMLIDAALRSNQAIPMPKRWGKRQRADRFHLQVIQFRELLHARKSDMVGVEGARNEESASAKRRDSICHVGSLTPQPKRVGSRKTGGKNDHCCQNDWIGNRRANNCTKFWRSEMASA